MIYKKISLSFMCGIILTNISSYSAYMTYQLSGGRFGDNLLAYMHGKWIAKKYKIPFVYTPFEYSDQLMLHSVEKQVKSIKFSKKVILTKNYAREIDPKSDILYSVPYFSEEKTEFRQNKDWIVCKINWNNYTFKSQLQELISPINKNLFKPSFPDGYIPVALHMRRGGGYDSPLLQDQNYNWGSENNYSDVAVPLKIPAFSFYVKAVKKLSAYLNNSNLYIFIFTDDKNPAILASRLKEELSDYKNLLFDFRQGPNSYNSNVIEDFFAMTQFVCIIRPQSNFSIVAAKIANFSVEIFPIDYIVINKVPQITQVEMKLKNRPGNTSTIFIE